MYTRTVDYSIKKTMYLWNKGILLNKHKQEGGGMGEGFDHTEITHV